MNAQSTAKLNEPSEEEIKQKAEKLAKQRVYADQTKLVNEVLVNKQGFEIEKIRNFSPDSQTINQWKLVEKAFAELLIEEGEMVLSNEYGTWWGRTGGNQSVKMDGVIKRLAKKFLMNEV